MDSIMNFFARRFLVLYFIAAAVLTLGFIRGALAAEVDNVVAVTEPFTSQKTGARIQMILLSLAPPTCKASGRLALHTARIDGKVGEDQVIPFCWRPVGDGSKIAGVRIYAPGDEPDSDNAFTLPIERFTQPKRLI